MDSVEKILLQVIAVVCTYLVISISFASAIQISIYQQIMRGATVTTTGEKVEITLDANLLVDKSFEFVHDPSDYKWENVQVKIEVIGKDPLYSVKKIYLFKCKDNNPLDCVDYEPVEADSYLSGEKGTFYWGDVSRNNAANFLTMIKFSYDEVDFWVGYWDQATRSGVQNFEHKDYDISHIDVYANPGIEPSWIREFIETYYMIPASWMERAALGAVNGKQTTELYEIVADKTEIDVPYFEKYKPSRRVIEKVAKDYLLAFAKGSVSNPVTFFSNPLPSCGDGACDVGENTENCCLDCGCPVSGQECSANSEYPNGLCHVCGDGVKDPVEDETNCCVDAGCPAGLDCDPNINIPHGKCIAPECGNGNCELSEDSGTCPVDCHNTPGKRCDDVYGHGYYYSSQLQECILAECGKRGCEPGEDYTNCCLDCDGCPTGEYCNTEQVPNGVCMAPTCGNGKCELGEDYTNCCLDCDGCPADPYTGQLQTCTQNICHLCGNGHIESPVETPETCCQDTGCIDGYCSVSGACKSESEMGMRVKILPETVDCTQGGEVDIRFTFAKGPAFFSSFETIAYTYDNSRYRLSQCVQQGDIYLCKLPLAGPETFPGCFKLGIKDVLFTVLFTYFDDAAGRKSNDLKYKELTVPFSFEVMKARQRTCNKNGACEPGIGETPETCCWDCQCEGGLVCTASGCKDEIEISLAVNPEDLPARNNIDCSPKNGMQPSDDFTFRSHVQNVPESAYEPFNVLNWKLEYNSKIYTAQNIPGFTCQPMITEYGHHTGDVECSVPVSMFPACPNLPPADLKLTLNILGGGLGGHYAPYEGKPVSAEFELDYVQGLPLCGNGEPNPELGETSDNCCRDMGCPDNKVCTLYSGCVDQGQVDLAVSVNPANIDCSRVPQEQRGHKQVIILASVTKKPYSPATGGIEFGDAYLDDSRIEEMGGICEPVVNSTEYSVYAWRCSIPVSDFNPFCWSAGSYTPNFETTITWQDKSGNRITKRIIKPVSFSVEIPRERQCVPDGFQDPELGEIIDQCCPDAGCSGGRVCTKEIVCVDPDQISLIVDDVSPDALDCSVKDDPENNIVVTVHIDNMPYDTHYIEWFMEYAGNTFTEQYFTCEPLMYGGLQSSSYRCEIPVYFFPACAEEGSHSLDISARITYSDYRGQIFQQEVSDDFTVNVGTAGLPNCGNGKCDKSLGETQDNCCQDCGCANKQDVCTVEGTCYSESEITMTIEPAALTTNCQLAPWDMDTYKVLTYQCVFQDPVKLRAHLSHKPWMASVISTSYVWNGEEAFSDAISSGEDIADGWNLYVILNPDGSYVISAFSGDKHVSQHQIKDATLTIQVPSHTGEYEKVIKVTSVNDVRVTVNEVKHEDLLELEKALKDAKKAMEKANRIVCSIVTILAICTVCSLMAAVKEKPPTTPEKPTIIVVPDDFGRKGWDELSTTPKFEYVPYTPTEKASPAPSFVVNAILPSVTAQTGTGLPMEIFTQLMSATSGMGKTGAGVVGLIAGLGFAWVMGEMLDCEDSFKTAVIAATVICGLIMYFKGRSALEPVAKICNLLSMALQLLMMINNLRSVTLNYEACMMQAESQLSTRLRKGETGYDRSRRIADYYRQLAACHQQLEGDTARLMERWAQFSYNLGASTGWSDTGVSTSPRPPATLGRGDPLTITYDYPSYGGRGEYGQIYITFENWWITAKGIIGKQSPTRTFRLAQSSGQIKCTVRSDGYGLDCSDPYAGYRGEGDNLIALACTQYVSGETAADKEAQCKGAVLEGTITVRWKPCDERRSSCFYQFGFNSQASGSYAEPAAYTGKGTATDPYKPTGESVRSHEYVNDICYTYTEDSPCNRCDGQPNLSDCRATEKERLFIGPRKGMEYVFVGDVGNCCFGKCIFGGINCCTIDDCGEEDDYGHKALSCLDYACSYEAGMVA